MLPQIAKYKAEIPRKSYDLRIAKHLPVERDHMDSSRKEHSELDILSLNEHRLEVANVFQMVTEKYNIRSHTKPYRAPLLNFKSLYPFSDDFDPAAVWGLRRLIRKGAIRVAKLYIFVLFLTICDLLFVGLNLFSPNRTRENVIPMPFSPHSPPKFSDHPFIFIICKLALWLGPEAPQWIQEWSRWDGLLPDGHWPSVDRNMDLSLVSRSPCPGLNALANHGIINKSGENLSFHRIASRISRTYNLSPALAVQLLLLRPDLNESTIEDQTKPSQELIEKHFPTPPTFKTRRISPEGPSPEEIETEEIRLKHSDFSNLLEMRRDEFFGGKLSDIRPFIGAGVPIHDHHHHHPQHPQHGQQSLESQVGFLDLVNLEVLPHIHWRPSNLQHPWGLTIFKLVYSTLKIEART
ncbi:hypothetical protein KEM48_000925 [Puccinia striiformis f. sp. tritici PST-130]|nr:hypothetical protein KEM48_000925 [Puccinia striiformis f. sp. tritici PST-130]